MLSSLRYDIYKPNIPHHVPGHNQRVRGGDSQGHACELSWEEAGFHQYRSASGVLRHAGGCRWGAVADRRQRRYGSQEEESAQGICRYSRGLHRVQPEHLGAARVQGVRGETLSYLQHLPSAWEQRFYSTRYVVGDRSFRAFGPVQAYLVHNLPVLV